MNTMPTRRPFFHQFMALTLLLCVVGIASAKDTRMLIDKIPVNFCTPQIPIGEDQYREQQSAMVQGLNEKWKGKYRIVAQRFYLSSHDQGTIAPWVAVEMGANDYIASKLDGKQEYLNAGSTEPAVAVWKVGILHPQRFALAMSNYLPDGSALCGYFEVEKE